METPSDSGGGGDASTNSVFYAVIGTIGALVLAVVCTAVIYQCIMLASWAKRGRNSTEEEE